MLNVQTVSGKIYDYNGEKLAWNKTDKPNAERKYKSKYNYTQLISYVTGGLEYIFYEELFCHGERKYESYYRGADIWLTIDDNLQAKSAITLQEYRKTADSGSIVIMRSDGSVAACTCLTQIDINSVNNEISSLKNMKEGFLINSPLDESFPCGSVIKPVLAEIYLDNFDELIISDHGYYTMPEGGNRVYNAGKIGYGKIGLAKALKYSSNQYFCTAGSRLGLTELIEKYRDFSVGKSLKTDIGMLNSRVLEEESPNSVCMDSIGQGVYISPVQLCCVAKEVATGELVEPYFITKMIKDERVVKEGKKRINKQLQISQLSREKVCKCLKRNAEFYGLEKNTLAKTGTSEIEIDDVDADSVGTLICAWPADKPDYYICMQVAKNNIYGIDLVKSVNEILKYLESHY